MLTKITRNNRLTLPKSVLTSTGEAEYYEITVESGRIILTPVRIQNAEAVRAKLEALGINEQDVSEAVQWARQK